MVSSVICGIKWTDLCANLASSKPWRKENGPIGRAKKPLHSPHRASTLPTPGSYRRLSFAFHDSPVSCGITVAQSRTVLLRVCTSCSCANKLDCWRIQLIWQRITVSGELALETFPLLFRLVLWSFDFSPTFIRRWEVSVKTRAGSLNPNPLKNWIKLESKVMAVLQSSQWPVDGLNWNYDWWVCWVI